MSKSVLTKLEDSTYEIIQPVDPIVWRDAQNKVFNNLSKDLEVKGFRKGHVPEAIARQHISPEKIFDAAISEVINDAFSAALDEHNLVPYTQPSVDISKLSDVELEFKFLVAAEPTIEIGQYKNLEIGHKEVNVTPEQVDLKILELRNQNAELVLKEGKADYGDTAIIDFKGFVDGVAFEGGEAENHALELGSGSFIPGFEEKIVGHLPGETFDVDVTFPQEYHEELKGKDATFKVTLHEIKQRVVPELNEEFITDLGYENVTTIEELREHVKHDLEEEAKKAEDNRYLGEVLSKIRETSKFEIADQIVANEAHHRIDQFSEQLGQQGLDLATYLSYTNTSEEDFHNKYHEEAEIAFKNFLIVKKVAELEELEVTDEVVDFEIAKIAMQYNMEEDQVRKIFFQDENGINQFKNSILHENVYKLLASSND